jgi:hypothetical protein
MPDGIRQKSSSSPGARSCSANVYMIKRNHRRSSSCSECHNHSCKGCKKPKCCDTVVNTLEDLSRLSINRLCPCATVKVLSLECTPFVLDPTSTAAVNGITVVATSTGAGRWLRQRVHIPHYTDQVPWFFDGQNVSGLASDENDGRTALTPLLTIAEFARRLAVAKYARNFGPYSWTLLSNVLTTDSFQWTFDLDTIGDVAQLYDGGTEGRIIVINATPTVIGTGTVGSYVNDGGNSEAILTRNDGGTWNLADIVRFTGNVTPGVAGRRVYIASGAGMASGAVNGNILDVAPPAVPTLGDTFELLRLVEFGVQIQNVGGQQSFVIEFNNLEFPASEKQWMADAITFRFQHTLHRVWTEHDDSDGDVRYGDFFGVFPSAVYIQSPVTAGNPLGLGFGNVERGIVQSGYATYINTIVDVTAYNGSYQPAGFDQFHGGGIRVGAPPPFISGVEAKAYVGPGVGFFNAPSIFPVNRYVSSGVGPAQDDFGAGCIVRRGGYMMLATFPDGFGVIVGNSVNPGTVGLRLLEGARVQVFGTTPTFTGSAGDIAMDSNTALPSGGDPIPLVSIATGVPIPAAPGQERVTMWQGPTDNAWDSPNRLRNAVNLRNLTNLVEIG